MTPRYAENYIVRRGEYYVVMPLFMLTPEELAKIDAKAAAQATTRTKPPEEDDDLANEL